MQTLRSAGARVLGEIEETTLDEVLASLRTSFAAATTNDTNADKNFTKVPLASTRLKTFPIGPLNDLVIRHFGATGSPSLAVTGRHRELLYVLIATLISPPHKKAVAVIDFEGRFDTVRLLATPVAGTETITSATTPAAEPQQPQAQRHVQRTDLDHVHIMRPARGSASHVADCLASLDEYLLYGQHRSRGREFWGTVVIGGGLNPAGRGATAGACAQVAVTADWKGWLRVDRADVAPFWDMSVQEALADRDKRQAAVDYAGWVTTSPWGGLTICRRERDAGKGSAA